MRVFVLIALLAAGFACGDGETPEPDPVREANGETLRRRFSNPSLPHAERLAAGRELLLQEDGVGFLASRYGAGDRLLVRTVTASFLVRATGVPGHC